MFLSSRIINSISYDINKLKLKKLKTFDFQLLLLISSSTNFYIFDNFDNFWFSWKFYWLCVIAVIVWIIIILIIHYWSLMNWLLILSNLMNFSYVIFSINNSINNCRIISLSNIIIINVFQFYLNIEMSSRFCKKHNFNYDVNEYKFYLNNILSINENKSLNDEKSFEIIDKKICR